MGDFRTPIERAVDSQNAAKRAGSLDWAAHKVRALAFEIIATACNDPADDLRCMQTFAARIDQLIDDALTEDRRQKETH